MGHGGLRGAFGRGKTRWICGVLLVLSLSFVPTSLYAQNAQGKDNEVKEILETGGYGAILGAAMGLAILPFISGSPWENIRIVAGGASLGFMFGSAYGFYDVERRKQESYMNYSYPQQTIVPSNGDYDPVNGVGISDPYAVPHQGQNVHRGEMPAIYMVSLHTPGEALVTGVSGEKGISWGVPRMDIFANQTVSVRLVDVSF